jgi:uncharacterized protein YyaL (SSP411 family)
LVLNLLWILSLITFVVGSASSTEVGTVLTNKLATAASPYLRGAAAQPVAWQPWGEEPFKLARTLDRPILLDIGAIWCHWCHVMDEETYSNPEVARLINDHFIAIKVDRDERPDIDARYQQAVQMLTGRGGWPLTVFLTPDGEVFHGGGTFFPDDRFGEPGFKRLLPAIAAAYRGRKEAVLALAEKVRRAVAASEAAVRKGDLSSALVGATAQDLVMSFDGLYAGFGRGAKFPMGSAIELAFRLYAESGDQQMLRIATQTLDAMANGGIHDLVGGGFHRYATDRAWQIPHFEKLDYVNAQLLLAYLQAYQATQQTRYREVAEGVIAYTNRVLSDQARGGFYAHQDADVGPGDDGGYYTWTLPEVKAALPPDETDVIVSYYGITGQGNMPTAPGRNVLRVVTTPEAIARLLSVPPSTVTALIASGTAHLLEARNKRPAPVVDRTIFANRNGMMITAYLEAYKALGREDVKAFALKSLELVLTHLRSTDGILHHALANGQPHVPGFLDDYAWVARALLEAFQVTGEARYLTAARDMMDRALDTFWDPAGGGFFDLRPEPTAVGLLKRPSKSFEDRDAPASNAVAALVLDQLAYLTNVQLYQQRAEQLLKAFAGTAPDSGRFVAGYALAVDQHLRPPAHAVIIGSTADSRTRALWQAALGAFRPGKIVAAYDPAHLKPADLPPPVAAAVRNTLAMGAPQAYVCVATACSLPAADPQEVSALVRTFQRYGAPASNP